MALWALTKNRIIDQIETILRRLTNKETPTYQERKTIEDAINAAIIDLCLDNSISRWRFIQSDETATTTNGTQYADLDANIFNIVSGTVRIEDKDVNLYPAELEFIYSSDPGRDDTGQPVWYAIDSSDDPETIRMVFKPIPDAAYTVAFVAETIPDENSISSFPSWTHACLKDKATENALRDLGLFNESMPFKMSYEKRKNDNKSSQGLDTPRHIRRASGVSIYRGLESRLPN